MKTPMEGVRVVEVAQYTFVPASTVNCVRGAVVSAPAAGNIARLNAGKVGAGPREAGYFSPSMAAPLVVWLTSADARDITGRYLMIDGPKVSIWEPKAPDTDIWSFPGWTADAIGEALGPLLRRRPPMVTQDALLVRSGS